MIKKLIVLDTETTGLEVDQGHRIIEIGAVLLEDRKKTDQHFHTYLNPQRAIDEEAQKVHGISNEKVKTYVLKHKDDLAGFFELIFHTKKKEVELAYFGLLEEYQNKKLGSHLLCEAIKISFDSNINRVWAHTCTLDHKNALNNYIARGMKIFKTENIKL